MVYSIYRGNVYDNYLMEAWRGSKYNYTFQDSYILHEVIQNEV